MRFFTKADLLHAVGAMLKHVDPLDKHLLGTLSGIKRRARARAIIEFAKTLQPPPPDTTITSTRTVLRELFGGRAVSNNDLQRHFATPGRKADDRVDAVVLRAWLDTHRTRLEADAARLLSDLDAEWRLFTEAAALDAGQRRRRESKARTR